MAVIILALLLVTMVIWHLIYVIRHKKNVLGRIVLRDGGSFYVELNDEESLAKIDSANYVTFKVSRK